MSLKSIENVLPIIKKIYYSLQIALIYASFACRIYGVPDPGVVAWSPPICDARSERVKFCTVKKCNKRYLTKIDKHIMNIHKINIIKKI